MPTQPEYALASLNLPPLAERLRREMGNEAFGALLGLITSDRPTIQIVRFIRKYYGLQIYPWHITIWRAVLTAPSRKLMPGLEVLVRQPLKLIDIERTHNEERESA